jgi:hypothetical protein
MRFLKAGGRSFHQQSISVSLYEEQFLLQGLRVPSSPFRDTVERPSLEIKAQASSRSYLLEKTFRERPEGREGA